MTTPEHASPDDSPLRALANPTRLRILSMLTARSMSATQVATALGIRHGSASYHLRKLKDAGLIETAEVVSVNGGRERRYRYALPAQTDAPRGRWNTDELLLVAESIWTELRRRAAHSAPGLSAAIDGEYWVPSEVWREVRHDIQEAARRLHTSAHADSSPGLVHVSLSALLFEIDPEAADA